MPVNVLELVDMLEPDVRKAFLASIADLKSEAQQIAIIEALRKGDIRGAVELVNLRPELFAPLDQSMQAAYIQGGIDAMIGLPRFSDPFRAGAQLCVLMHATRAPKTGLENNLPD